MTVEVFGRQTLELSFIPGGSVEGGSVRWFPVCVSGSSLQCRVEGGHALGDGRWAPAGRLS